MHHPIDDVDGTDLNRLIRPLAHLKARKKDLRAGNIRRSFEMEFNYYNENWIKKTVLGVRELGVIPSCASIMPYEEKAAVINPAMVFLGSGYYHGFTFNINRELFNKGASHDLIVFDQHSDYQRIDGADKCGVGCANWMNYFNSRFYSKSLIIGLGRNEAKERFPSKIMTTGSAMERLDEKLSRLSDNVYVSYDLDVISYDKYGEWYSPEISNSEHWIRDTSDAVTLYNVLEATKKILAAKQVIGVDVCGHRPEFPTGMLGWPGTLTMMGLIANQFTRNTSYEDVAKHFNKDDSWCTFEKWYNVRKLISKNQAINNAVNLQELPYLKNNIRVQVPNLFN